jgi:regulator of cell morphogenesis and NO signaling
MRLLIGRRVGDEASRPKERDAMTLSPDLSLAEIVDLVPGAPRVFESYGLDYCCGGRKTLREACDRTGVDAAVVGAGLDALDARCAPDWVPMSPALLVDHLERTHHAYLRVELPRLVALADKVARVHGGRHPELLELRRLCSSLRDDLMPHMAKEEQVLFPMIRDLAAAISPPSFHCGSVANPISRMTQEHEQTGELLEAIRDVTGWYRLPDDACASYRALYEGLAELEEDTHLHIHKENNTLFPAVIALERRWR